MDIFYTPDRFPFYLMAKPVGAACNLDCEYCYYLDKADLYPEKAKSEMSDSLLYKYIQTYIDSQARPEIMFTWHGGEPLLRDISFYKKALDCQKYAARGRRIRVDNSLQTNGTLLNDEWCEFFKRNNFLIGISVDGPAHCHNYFRKYRSGTPSFTRVYQGLKLLQKHKVEYNILTTVNSYNVQYPMDVYDFFRKSGAQYIQFTPIVEWYHTSENREVNIPEFTPWTVDPDAYGKFLCTIYDEWVRNDVGKYFVINFDAALANRMAVPPPLCIYAETCGHAMAMEHNGDVYACDHFVYPKYKRGNINTDSLIQMAYSADQIAFGNNKRDSLPSQCRSCEFLVLCNGECPKNRILETTDGDKGLNYLCRAFKMFYSHIREDLDFMANELKNQRPPAGIMKLKRK